MEILYSSAYAPFVVAICLVLLFGVLEVVGLMVAGAGISDMAEWLSHTDTFPETAWTNWLIVKGLPLSIAIVLYLTCFGAAGLLTQGFALSQFGTTLDPVLAAAIATVVAWFGLRLGGRYLAPLFGTNTDAVSADSLLGRNAKLLSPRCTPGLPADARVLDEIGNTHSVMVTPAAGQGEFAAGDVVVLHERIGRNEFTVRKA